VSSAGGRRSGDILRRGRRPLLGLAGIGVLDLVRTARTWPVPLDGALDEPAHAATAALLLAALPHRPVPRLAAWALAGSVAIDVDHVPLYAGLLPSAVPGGRPVTHCLLTPAALAAAAAVTRGRLRTAFGGLALGVCLHFVRDVATGGTGVPLFWPADRHSDVRAPYAAYLALLAAAAAAATRRTGG
jgi:inner membrane protein